VEVAAKVVLTHRGALRRKYGAAGVAALSKALTALKAADRRRGVRTRVLFLDAPAHRKYLGGVSVSDPHDPRAVKVAVDALFATLAPDYLLLLGAPDVVPQIPLQNPLYTGDRDDDPDPAVPSDLPYACDAPYSTSPSEFRGPTRVVGRLPDALGATEPSHLLARLAHAARWRTRTFPRPLPVFALSALTWRASTETSIAALGGAAGPVLCCPGAGPEFAPAQLAAPLHFINCHGLPQDPVWYGELFRGQATLPHALDARLLAPLADGSRPSPLTSAVLAAECCYGGMHWNPADAGGQESLAATYLRLGASAVLAASTLTYGPAVGNGSADLITRMFLEAVAGGASVGRAALQARQRFVTHAATLDPTDQKTLAQFDLWGDPSVHPIAPVGVGGSVVEPAGPPPAEGQDLPHGPLRGGVRQRRAALSAVGHALHDSVAATGDAPRGRAGLSTVRFAQLAGQRAGAARIRTFDTMTPGQDAAQFHVAFLEAEVGPRRLVVVRAEAGQASVVQHLERK
jgi:hypothetical protein